MSMKQTTVRDHPVTITTSGRWNVSLTTLVPSTDGVTEYRVVVRRESRDSGTCECLSFVYRGRCKHLAAVVQLAELGGVWS